MKYIIGEKQEMTQIFTEDGKAHPATVLAVEPIVVTQVKSKEKDGYQSVQVGFGKKKEKNVAKAQIGHAGKLGSFRGFKEFRYFSSQEEIPYAVGDSITVSVFVPGDSVTVSSVSKGKGFQGVVKRHGFKGGPRTHGQKHSEREPGSIGATGPQKILKGTRMAGRMGGRRVTVRNVTILQVDPENNRILVRGAVPGRRGSIVELVSKR
jgi:large subunit ribosomal protein L3